MKKIAFLVFALVMVIPSASSLADGVFYWREEVPPGIPYQRALLLFDGNRETLIIQSKYELPDPKASDIFGWVVPVPAVPELASMGARKAFGLFDDLGRHSSPDTTSISGAFFVTVVLTAAFGAPAVLLLCALASCVQRLGFIRRREGRILFYTLFFVTVVGWICLAIPNFLGAGESSGVDVILAQEVGIYDVRVVKSDRADDLIQWLNENQFHFSDSDRKVFDDYLQRGWCFVVAKINPRKAGEDPSQVESEGLVAPLIMRFPTKYPIYPLALTSTAGQDTQVLLYVAANGKMKTDGRLKLRYAGPIVMRPLHEIEPWHELEHGIDPGGFFSMADLNLTFLCRFKSTLTSDQMKTDLILEKAPDDRPYREHEFRW